MPHRAPRFRHLWLVACLSAARLGAAASPSNEYQDVAQLEALARSAAQRALPPLSDRQRLLVGPLQPRLQLERCENAVKSLIAPGLRIAGRVVIELRCEGPSAWHLYVPVRAVGTSQAVIAAHAIVAGTVLTVKDLGVEQRDVGDLPPGDLDDPAIAIGLTASRPISGGAVLTNQQL